MSRGTILVIEDDREIVELIDHHIRELGYDVESSGDGEEGLERALSGKYSLVVLDVMLPKLGGLEVCREIRKNGTVVPVLMLTARSEDLDKILGLELGADDYLTKPFNVLEFRARVGALLRRAGMSDRTEPRGTEGLIKFRNLVINHFAHQATLEGKPLDLTPTEYGILSLLLTNAGRVVQRETLLREIWQSDLESYECNVTTHVSRLRSKLSTTPGYADRIRTVRGVGYRFETEENLPPE